MGVSHGSMLSCFLWGFTVRSFRGFVWELQNARVVRNKKDILLKLRLGLNQGKTRNQDSGKVGPDMGSDP